MGNPDQTVQGLAKNQIGTLLQGAFLAVVAGAPLWFRRRWPFGQVLQPQFPVVGSCARLTVVNGLATVTSYGSSTEYNPMRPLPLDYAVDDTWELCTYAFVSEQLPLGVVDRFRIEKRISDFVFLLQDKSLNFTYDDTCVPEDNHPSGPESTAWNIQVSHESIAEKGVKTGTRSRAWRVDPADVPHGSIYINTKPMRGAVDDQAHDASQNLTESNVGQTDATYYDDSAIEGRWSDPGGTWFVKLQVNQILGSGEFATVVETHKWMPIRLTEQYGCTQSARPSGQECVQNNSDCDGTTFSG